MNRVWVSFVACFLIAVSSLLLQQECWAASKSHTVTVSCTVIPILGLASKPMAAGPYDFDGAFLNSPGKDEISLKLEKNMVNVVTNLGRHYQLHQELLRTVHGPVKLYSLTAL